MSDDGARYLERVIRERDEWRRVANDRAVEVIRIKSRDRRMVLMLALLLRQASRDLRRVERGKQGEYPAESLPFYRGTFIAARTAHERAREILRGQTLGDAMNIGK